MKILFKSIHGSRLYGTSHEGSDTDYKCVFSKSLSELVVDTPDCYREHSPDDTEFFSLKKYALLLGQQQTNAIEMLFTPNEFIVETSPAWEQLRENKHRLVSKNIMPFVGYAKQQARVYSSKGSSLNMLKALNAILKVWLSKNSITDETRALEFTEDKYCFDDLSDLMEAYPQLLSRGEKLSTVGEPIPYINVLNKQFECFVPVKEWASRIQKMIDTYGERAKDAALSGAFDRKAMYHAWRIIDEAVELLETGTLTLPRPIDAITIMRAIRFDEDVSFDEAQSLLMSRYNYLMEDALINSTLPEQHDKSLLDTWFKYTQQEQVKKELKLG